ncbi:DUF4436 family protein [Skermania sp. ID1734]|uniref:DUF4436 family protein n=1 Tax=Skermania sp. ID1734 TaxID=2597516 RepID=UPI00163DCC21|nr:DUF4436 family protein [Skermania sp. ID1734]
MSEPTTARKRLLPWLIGAVVVIAYAVAVVLGVFAVNDQPYPENLVPGEQPESVLWVSIEDVHTESRTLDANVTFVAGKDLSDSEGRLKKNLTVDLYPRVRLSEIAFPAGRVPGTVAVELATDGDPASWPFDRYVTEPVYGVVTVEDGAGRSYLSPNTLVTASLSGWRMSARGMPASPDYGTHAQSVTITRSNGTITTGAVLCLLLICVTALGLIVAINTLRGKRPFYPPMVTWFGALVFAVAPLRALLPGTPPPGAWVDRLVVLWVLGGLIVAMAIYVRCWWKAG